MLVMANYEFKMAKGHQKSKQTSILKIFEKTEENVGMHELVTKVWVQGRDGVVFKNNHIICTSSTSHISIHTLHVVFGTIVPD